MQSFENLSTKAKLALSLFISVLSLLILGIVSINGLSKVNNSTNSLYTQNYVPLSEITEINDLMRTNFQQVLLAGYHDSRLEVSKEHEKTHSVSAHLDEIPKNAKKITELWDKYVQRDLGKEESKLSQEYASLRASFVKEGLIKAVELYKTGDFAKAQAHTLVVIPLFNKAKEKAEELLSLQQKLANEKIENSTSIYAETETILWIAIIISIILLITISLITLKNITSSIVSIQQGLLSFFSFLGRETTQVDVIKLNSNDEFGQMAKVINKNIVNIQNAFEKDTQAVKIIEDVVAQAAFGFVSVRVHAQSGSKEIKNAVDSINKMLESFEGALSNISNILISYAHSNYIADIKIGHYSGEFGGVLLALKALGESTGDFMALVRKNGDSLNHGSETLNIASEGLSTASNEQASSLEQTAAAIEELTSNIAANSQKALEMAALAKETEKAANEGITLANTTVVSMNEISNATQAIDEAVSIIENIAFQTNILSLNAAVEAATAGDAGKGFAVVAQEVRNLANRSADAAKEIKIMAEQANIKASDGLRISEDLMRGFDTINQKITQTSHLVQDVANGSHEQMQGINQINSAVIQLDQMTQRNASSANEVNLLANNILNMAKTLQDTASKTTYEPNSSDRICRIDMMFDTTKLKLDHVVFKNNNFSKLKENGIKSWAVTNEKQCNLGKWIESHSNEDFAKTKSWEELLLNHTCVHQKVQDFITKKTSGNLSIHGIKLLSTEIEDSTAKVFEALNKVRHEACKNIKM
ncbi:MAG TPA: hypothetical protein CFH78_07435 [Sulfurimonas sp. UBA10385]|nr:MAG TPA: hypothetical protein CFH78_07435 [Sulfurimonas sp. UBA10385]